MRVHFDSDGKAEHTIRAVDALVEAGAKSIQFFSVPEARQPPGELERLDRALRECPVPIFGGLFPGLIYEGASYDRGTLALGHDEVLSVCVLDEGERSPVFPEALYDAKTFFAYVDATCESGDIAMLLYRELGGDARWVGGGAGDLDFERRPVIVTPTGLQSGCAVLAGSSTNTTVGVSHGWKPFGEALIVTESDGNDVIALDWQPAFEVYQALVEKHSGRSFEDGFFELASSYPLILERMGAEGIVRDPLALLPNGVLRCAGGVPTNSTVRVATSTLGQMLEASSSSRIGIQRSAQLADAPVLTIDCISRSLLLGADLAQELETLRIPSCPQVGVLSIGEIANDGSNMLQVHNKTTVLATLEEG